MAAIPVEQRDLHASYMHKKQREVSHELSHDDKQLSCGRTHENRDILNTSIRRLYNVHASFFARTLAHVQNTQHSSSLCLIKLPYDHTWYIGGDGSIPHELECLYHYAQFVDASSLLVSRQHHNNLTHY
uniref:Uncharacterized protein n=1 Tax=Hyaloperonospora arabidopsidis (strain Emoy2) TaxID=559515 RepID=M4BMH7_HYAAE